MRIVFVAGYVIKTTDKLREPPGRQEAVTRVTRG